MLQVFAFDKIGVVLSDLYFVDPNPGKGQEGPERGVRLEVRILSQGELNGSIYSARPIEVGEPVWRADLLEAADAPGSLNRAHHHPTFHGWEPGKRVFERGLSSDPVHWVGEQLANLEGLLEQAGLAAGRRAGRRRRRPARVGPRHRAGADRPAGPGQGRASWPMPRTAT